LGEAALLRAGFAHRHPDQGKSRLLFIGRSTHEPWPWTAAALLPLSAKQPCCELASLTNIQIKEKAAFFHRTPPSKEPDSWAVTAKAAAGLPQSKESFHSPPIF
jgi:hypothetical protein